LVNTNASSSETFYVAPGLFQVKAGIKRTVVSVLN